MATTAQRKGNELISYLCNFNARRDASIAYVGPITRDEVGSMVQTIAVEIYDMAAGMIVQIRDFQNLDAATRFANRELRS